ncbi:MAG: putative OsmC-like protein [Pseudohongiellaceae bacterium]|jgi:uncharacterized OsmC-like protein
MNDQLIVMAERQAPLAKIYLQDPKQAMITDSASSQCMQTEITDPLHGKVTAGGLTIPIAVHSAVGGNSDGAVPGDLLCAALASCIDSTIRIVANRLGLILNSLEVSVTAEVDVRGTLCLQPEVPVGFQAMHLSVLLGAKKGTNQKLISALFQGAERSCVILQTLKSALQITTQFEANIDTLIAQA